MATQEETEKVETLGRWAKATTFFITKITQVAGLWLGINELAVREETSVERMFFAAFIMAGAQGFSTVSMYAIDRMTGNGSRVP